MYIYRHKGVSTYGWLMLIDQSINQHNHENILIVLTWSQKVSHSVFWVIFSEEVMYNKRLDFRGTPYIRT